MLLAKKKHSEGKYHAPTFSLLILFLSPYFSFSFSPPRSLFHSIFVVFSFILAIYVIHATHLGFLYFLSFFVCLFLGAVVLAFGCWTKREIGKLDRVGLDLDGYMGGWVGELG